MVNGLSYHLLKVQFQLYVTLTFGGNWNDKKSRNKTERIYSWLRFVYGHHCDERTLEGKIFVIAEELGELNDRYHVHLLLGSLPKTPTKGDCFAMAHLWKESLKGGFAVIRPYNPSLRGVGYVLKSLDLVDLRSISSESSKARVQTLAGVHVGCNTTFAGANAYEVGKIGLQYEQGLDVTISLGLQALLQSGANSRRGSERSRGFFVRRSKRRRAHTGEKRAKL
ncbi:MAG: hypothetical protein ABIS50_22505 [Luteolibacter sp.]|uniref:hypothetical protein n=1 Tax=Luteolibacter sp. TaxID=1962973 RepID=UPI003267138B